MEVWGGNCAASKSFTMPGLDVWVWCRPCRQADTDSGDVHFLSSCASGRITRMLLADIIGHGTLFASLATDLRDLMIRNVNWPKQRRIVQETHQRLQRYSTQGAFATALISTFFAPTKSFTLCNAGHPSPLLYRASSGGWSEMKRSHQESGSDSDGELGAIGLHDYQQFETRLDYGDMVLGYSNVLTECRRANGQLLGVNGLLRQVEQIDAARPSRFVATLIARIEGAHTANLHDHDATVILCRATKRSVGWRNNLLAPFRLLRSVTDETHLNQPHLD
jgi:serine phosphatase RsbU (regulator of sigma subunit)